MIKVFSFTLLKHKVPIQVFISIFILFQSDFIAGIFQSSNVAAYSFFLYYSQSHKNLKFMWGFGTDLLNIKRLQILFLSLIESTRPVSLSNLQPKHVNIVTIHCFYN